MSTASDTQLFLEERLTACCWHIAKTVALGALAAGFGVFGQECLLRARPIFPLIDQNYVLWQTAYMLVLMVMGLIWAAALLQKINLRQDYQRHIRMHRQREEQKAARAARIQAVREERQQKAQAAYEPPPRPKQERSSKFDY